MLQAHLFERIAIEIGPLGECARLLIAVLTLVNVRRHLGSGRGWVGHPAKDRDALASAFVAKTVYGLETTRQLRERLGADPQLRCLCGWNTRRQIPRESTFSRAFAEFAASELPRRLHAALIWQPLESRMKPQPIVKSRVVSRYHRLLYLQNEPNCCRSDLTTSQALGDIPACSPFRLSQVARLLDKHCSW